eukprot:7007203-Alexandrium_andersonii.AAC.2
MDAGAAELGAFLQAMRTAGCEHTVLVAATHPLSNGEVATPEWVMAAAVRVWGARALPRWGSSVESSCSGGTSARRERR